MYRLVGVQVLVSKGRRLLRMMFLVFQEKSCKVGGVGSG